MVKCNLWKSPAVLTWAKVVLCVFFKNFVNIIAYGTGSVGWGVGLAVQ